MKEIRNLLLDCRGALRKADREFEHTPLGEQLDDTIIALGQAVDREAAAAAQDKPAAQRVAYAWQSVARALRHSHPSLYQQLSERVLARLDVEVLDDQVDEIEALQERLREREAALEKTGAELAALCAELASAVPLADAVGGSETELARRRVQQLVQALAQGGGLPKATPTPRADDDAVPDRALLQAVAAGERALSGGQREWCISEAMVLTGFQLTPVQLLERGEAALARLVLDGVQQQA